MPALGVLEVRNPGDRSVYVHVLSVEESRNVAAIDPQSWQDPKRLGPGESCTVLFGVPARRDWPLERAMLDRYLVIASERPADFSILANEGLRSAGRPLPPLVERALQGPRYRSAGPVPVSREAFGVSVLDLYVENPR